IDVRGGMPVEIAEARPVRHEAPGLHVLPVAVCCRQVALCCEVCKPFSVEAEDPICQYEECSPALFGARRQCALQLVCTSGRQAREEPEPDRIGTTSNHDDGDRSGSRSNLPSSNR